jgi:hypothetical protein
LRSLRAFSRNSLVIWFILLARRVAGRDIRGWWRNAEADGAGSTVPAWPAVISYGPGSRLRSSLLAASSTVALPPTN